MTWTISAAVNLILSLAAYSFLAYAMARFGWRKRGMLLVFIAIFLCAQVWLVAQFITTSILGFVVQPYWLLTANWIVSACAIALLWLRFKDAARESFESARMDGCGAIGIYWHIILPLVRGTLCLLALFTVLACALDFFTHTLDLEMAQRLRLYGANIPVLLSGSAVAALPLFAIFLLVKKLFPQM